MNDTSALARLLHAADAPHEIAAEFRAAGERVVWTLGWDLPRELVDAFGLHPVRLVPMKIDDAAIGSFIGNDSLGARGRSLITTIAGLPPEDAVLISHADAEQPQLFATLRELARCGLITPPPIHFLDLLTIDRPATRRYNRIRIKQAMAWLGALDGAATPDLGHAIRQNNLARKALQQVLTLRDERLSGAEAHRLVAASATTVAAQAPTPSQPPAATDRVIYFEVAPSEVSRTSTALKAYRQTSQKAAGVVRVQVLQQIGRPNFFVWSAMACASSAFSSRQISKMVKWLLRFGCTVTMKLALPDSCRARSVSSLSAASAASRDGGTESACVTT